METQEEEEADQGERQGEEGKEEKEVGSMFKFQQFVSLYWGSGKMKIAEKAKSKNCGLIKKEEIFRYRCQEEEKCRGKGED